MNGAAAFARERFHVQMADVDAAGILYYASPLRWTERLLGAWMRSIGLPVSEMLARGVGAPAVHTEIDYRRPLRLDDPVEGELLPIDCGRSSYGVLARFRRADEDRVATEVRVTFVWVSHDTSSGVAEMASSELPPQIAESFSHLLAGQ